MSKFEKKEKKETGVVREEARERSWKQRGGAGQQQRRLPGQRGQKNRATVTGRPRAPQLSRGSRLRAPPPTCLGPAVPGPVCLYRRPLLLALQQDLAQLVCWLLFFLGREVGSEKSKYRLDPLAALRPIISPALRAKAGRARSFTAINMLMWPSPATQAAPPSCPEHGPREPSEQDHPDQEASCLVKSTGWAKWERWL